MTNKQILEDAKRAIEHAEYLAKGAESLLNHLNDISDIEKGTINPDENFKDFTGSLRNYVYEFRKRAQRFEAELTKARALDNANKPMHSSMQTESKSFGTVMGFADEDGNIPVKWHDTPNVGEEFYTHPAPVTSMQGDSEPIGEVRWCEALQCNIGDLGHNEINSGTKLYLHADRVKGVSDNANAKDAERYKFIKANYAMANFDLYDAEIGEPKVCGIIFEVPNGTLFSADFDATIDSAINAQQER